MIQLKKPLDKSNYNKGYKIVTVPKELASIQLSKPESERNEQWKGVEVATLADIAQWGKKGETLTVEPTVKVKTEIKEEATNVNEVAELPTSESEVVTEKRKYKKKSK